MKNVIRLSFLIISLLLVAACGNNDNSNGQNEGNSNNASNVNSDNEAEQTSEKLRLGDTGTIKDTIGEYEITPSSFEITDSVDGDVPTTASRGDQFIIVEITIKNIGDSALVGSDITRTGVALFDDEDGLSDNY